MTNEAASSCASVEVWMGTRMFLPLYRVTSSTWNGWGASAEEMQYSPGHTRKKYARMIMSAYARKAVLDVAWS